MDNQTTGLVLAAYENNVKLQDIAGGLCVDVKLVGNIVRNAGNVHRTGPLISWNTYVTEYGGPSTGLVCDIEDGVEDLIEDAAECSITLKNEMRKGRRDRGALRLERYMRAIEYATSHIITEKFEDDRIRIVVQACTESRPDFGDEELNDSYDTVLTNLCSSVDALLNNFVHKK